MYQENITALKKDAPIGVFDSGIGGLTVAREICLLYTSPSPRDRG